MVAAAVAGHDTAGACAASSQALLVPADTMGMLDACAACRQVEFCFTCTCWHDVSLTASGAASACK